MENQPNEICSPLTEKASKGRFLKPENGSKITVTKEKEGRKRKSDERSGKRKSNGCTLSFYNEHTLDTVFGREKVLDGKGPFDDNVFKNPARYIQLNICYYIRSKKRSS